MRAVLFEGTPEEFAKVEAMFRAGAERSWTVRLNDRLFLQGGGIPVNRARVTEFGLLVGEVVCVFRRPSPSAVRRSTRRGWAEGP